MMFGDIGATLALNVLEHLLTNLDVVCSSRIPSLDESIRLQQQEHFGLV